MLVRHAAVLMVLMCCALAFAEDKPAVAMDPVKYPQDTPEKALDTLAKSLEANDLAYWQLYIATPAFTERMIAKYKTIEAAVAANINDPKKIEGRKRLAEFVRSLQADKSPAVADKVGTAVRFFGKDGQFVQLEQQADKRWCFNTTMRKDAPPATAPATTTATTK